MSTKHKFHPAGVGMTPSKSELVSFIRARRLELDIRQVPLAELSGLAQGLVSQLEVGTRKFLNNKQLEDLAKALQCNSEELRKRMPEKHTAKPTTELGKMIRSRREELGLTLEVFAKKLRLTPKQAKHLEISKSPSLRYPLAEPLAKALKLDVSTFAKFVGRKGKVTGSELGQLVRLRRKELAMSLGKLAKKLGVSRQFVDQIESGQCRLSTNNEMIEQLAEVLELDVNQLNAVRSRRRLKQMGISSTPLSGFLAGRRLELRLTQREVSDRAKTATATISDVETGRVYPTPNLLDKLAKALECEIPPEIIPPARERKLYGGEEPGFTLERTNPLGEFVTTRRLELRLTQSVLAQRAETNPAVISGIERGTYRLGRTMLERVSKALECEIPVELIPEKKRAGERSSSSSMVQLFGHALDDLDKIKKLADVKSNSEVVRKAVSFLRLLLEKQQDDYIVRLVKGKEVVELKILL